MEKYKTAGSLVIETIMSESWIIDTLKILKMYKNGKYYKQSVAVAYITGLILVNTSLRYSYTDEEVNEIITALLVGNIGATITADENYKSQIKETTEYLSTRTSNTHIVEMVHDQFEREDGSGLFHKKGFELSKGTKLCIVSLGVERLLRKLRDNSFSKEETEKLYMNREEFKYSMDMKYDVEIVAVWKDTIRKLIPEMERTRIYLGRYLNITVADKISMPVTPIELVVDSILKNLWIKDFLDSMKKREDSFLFIHSLNTGIYTASIILMNNYDFALKGKVDISDIVIGSVLHDIGYIVRETINHQYHLCMNMNKMENEICKWHIIQGKEIITEFFREKRLYNKDIILDIIENHHEYEDATGCLKRQIKNPAIKIVNMANAIDLQMYRLYKEKDDFFFAKTDSKYKTVSQKFDAAFAGNVISCLINMLNNISAIITE